MSEAKAAYDAASAKPTYALAAGETYAIANLDDLVALSTLTNDGLVAPNSAKGTEDGAKIIVTKDVDASGTKTTPFRSIGIGSNFNATFDGQGHRITGFTQVADDKPGGIGRHLGFFYIVSYNGVVRNLRLIDVDISASQSTYAAGFVHDNYGLCEACGVTGTVAGSSAVSGFLYENYGNVLACCCNVEVTVGAGGGYGAAFAERHWDGLFAGCYARGAVFLPPAGWSLSPFGTCYGPTVGLYAACFLDGPSGSSLRRFGFAARVEPATAVFFDNEVVGEPAIAFGNGAPSTPGQTTRQMKGLDPIEDGKNIITLLNEELDSNGLTDHRFEPDTYNINNGYPVLDWQNRAYEQDLARELAEIPFSFKTTAGPGGSITTDLGPVCSISVNPEEQKRRTITIEISKGNELKSVRAGGINIPDSALQRSKNTVTFEYPLPGQDPITHDINMHAEFEHKLRRGQNSAIPSA
ncbi:hypothetical protein FACS189481_0140 [Clostridia bacterium]|nr:hypothetical protein FACS189481_0140 [Clostridia bacterium]